MMNKLRIGFVFFYLGLFLCSRAQTWVDSLDQYARQSYLPASQYKWRWTHAALLHTMIKQYENGSAEQKKIYLAYIQTAMDKTYGWANGKTPNAVASGMGLAFLYRITREQKYKTKAEKIYADYLKIRRSPEGGVSHLMLFTELWDDTIYMIGEFLLQMYAATGDEKYLDEWVKQFRIHREKLQQKETGLWVHGWDSDDKIHCTFCSQMHWADQQTRKSAEIWGRGNGWIIVTLADALQTISTHHRYWNELAGYLREMIEPLPALQDAATGHWFQLPLRNTDADNWIESSCTAMFAYGMQTALEQKIVEAPAFKTSVEKAYTGLRAHSVVPAKRGYLTTQHICTGTCIGNKTYYLKRGQQKGKPYGLGMFIQFGRKYEAAQRAE